MKIKISPVLIFCLAVLFGLSSCTGQTQLVLTPMGEKIPSPTITVTPSLTPTPVLTTFPTNTPTLLPSPTPTPRVHQVKSGETLGVIAWTYGVSLDELLAMNPDVDARAMSVGIELLIPYQTVTPANQTPVPTAVFMPVEHVSCQTAADGGIWCFMTVKNSGTTILESVSVNVNIADMEANQVFAQMGYAPLNLLNPGETMPVAVYFSPPVPSPFQYSAQFVSAIPLDDAGSRYVSVTLSEVETGLDDLGRLGNVTGKYTLADQGSVVRIVAAAYDENGSLIGLRRWEQQGQLTEGSFDFQVYAVTGIIDHIAVLAEAQR